MAEDTALIALHVISTIPLHRPHANVRATKRSERDRDTQIDSNRTNKMTCFECV